MSWDSTGQAFVKEFGAIFIMNHVKPPGQFNAFLFIPFF